ncbi:MAG: YggS family pyridoxal phosphate-dependent enzyme [Bacteroidetes bacterium]|nr:MAG: YggS family pyridoxal phosphate-dependent enzyme [Bacteroidota bacterium]
MSIASNIDSFEKRLKGTGCRLVAVSKTKSASLIMEAYHTGFNRFGENRVQELTEKYRSLPKDIEWHMIGHLQTNKVKMIASFVSMIHGVDSLKLAAEINKQAARYERLIPCLLQVHIAKEESKFGFEQESLVEMITTGNFDRFSRLKIAGLMGMATFTEDKELIRGEFRKLKQLFDQIKSLHTPPIFDIKELSMGMSNDFEIAIEEGSTLIRIGSSIFGARN